MAVGAVRLNAGGYDAAAVGEQASTVSRMMARTRLGSSHIGMWPQSGITTVRAPGMPALTGRTSRSRSPNASVTGTATRAGSSKAFDRIALLVAS